MPALIKYSRSSLSRELLTRIKRKCLRRGAWFRSLSVTERGIINLTIKCVEKVRSRRLVDTLNNIIAKIADILESRFMKLVRSVGIPLAEKAGRLAQSWGNKSAHMWATDPGLARYLTVQQLSTRGIFTLPT